MPVIETVALSKGAAAVLRATADLMETISDCLPVEKQEALMLVLIGGGRVGLEITIDRNMKNLINVVAVEPEGRHRTIATVAAIESEKEGVAH